MAIWRAATTDITKLNAALGATLGAHIGIEVLELGEDYLKARMPVDDRTRQPFGRLHGGASVALAETAASFAANLTLDMNVSVAVGLEINANHVRPAKDGWVYAIARPEALGRKTQVWSIRITDEEDRLVCISRCSLAVIPAHEA